MFMVNAVCKRTSFILFIFSVSLNVFSEDVLIGTFGDVKIVIKTKKFDISEHDINYCRNTKIPCLIDTQYYYGGNGSIPKVELSELNVYIEGVPVSLDSTSIYNPGITKNNIKKRFNVQKYLSNNTYRVIGYFGNKKNLYIGQWLVQRNGSIRNHLGDYESLKSLVFEVDRNISAGRVDD